MARTPLAHKTLDHLDRDHASGEKSIRDLEHALLGFEMMGEPRRQAFEDAAKGYVSFYLAHMTMEEELILPLTEMVLTDDDWREHDNAFGANCDPLTGHEPDQDYRALFTRIVGIVPAPFGLGESSHTDTLGQGTSTGTNKGTSKGIAAWLNPIRSKSHETS